jgi:hypothetical protein
MGLILKLLSLITLPIAYGNAVIHSAFLDPDQKYYVTWEILNNTITFDVSVSSKGYIGFGVSNTPGMNKADMIISGIGKSESTPQFSVKKHKET